MPWPCNVSSFPPLTQIMHTISCISWSCFASKPLKVAYRRACFPFLSSFSAVSNLGSPYWFQRLLGTFSSSAPQRDKSYFLVQRNILSFNALQWNLAFRCPSPAAHNHRRFEAFYRRVWDFPLSGEGGSLVFQLTIFIKRHTSHDLKLPSSDASAPTRSDQMLLNSWFFLSP